MNRKIKIGMWILIPAITVVAALTIFQQRNKHVPVPDSTWKDFEAPSARVLNATQRKQLEGVYQLRAGQDSFGNTAVVRWSFTGPDSNRFYRAGIFFEKDAIYFICEGRQVDSNILLKGYWRELEGLNGATGPVHLTVPLASLRNGRVSITGQYGKKANSEPDRSIALDYQRPLYQGGPLEIIAHRGGGRTGDYLPSSENTVELIREAALFGASGVEIDVQLTKDRVPIVFHDGSLTARSIEGVYKGKVSELSFAELQKIPLKKGETIPTLEEALTVITRETPLRFVWLDAKDSNTLDQVRALQQRFTREAGPDRKLEIVIGIHDENVLAKLRQLPDYRKIPTLCELEPDTASSINARIWAPIWTEGLQEEAVAKMRREGRRAFVWTIDKEKQIKEFLFDGGYDGMVTNFPSRVAFYHFSRQ